MSTLPLPPLELAYRVGALPPGDEAWRAYEQIGSGVVRSVTDSLPTGWSFAGRRVLDFGCGAGRTLRHMIGLADEAELVGCDIDAPSIEWLEQNLSPPLTVLVNATDPPLPLESGSFDLIYAASVFTHITDNWAAWLLDLHRLLREDGILIASFLGPVIAPQFSAQPWDDSLFGMNIFRYDESFDIGGPNVVHSPWWLRAHWGRAFEITAIHDGGFASASADEGQGYVVARKLPYAPTIDELLAPEPHEPREATALAHNVSEQLAEIRRLREQLTDLRDQRDHARAAQTECERSYGTVVSSRSWRLTGPLRRVAARARGLANPR